MSPKSPDDRESNRRLVDKVSQAVGELGIRDPEAELVEETAIQQLRRSRRRRVADNVELLSLVEVDGLLDWEPGFRTHAHPRSGRRRRRAAAASGQVLKHFKFTRLEPNEVTGYLQTLDGKLTPQQGLRRWNGKRLVASRKAPAKGRILLFVHGTFSNNDNFLDNLKSTKQGAAFLSAAFAHYKRQVYAFDHPTLSVGPLHNALDLAEFFRHSEATVDVIAHSRGGLVTRWWFEALSPQPAFRGSAVLVGAPLAGTSLAAPHKLRSSLKLLTNFGRALGVVSGMASAAVPLLVGVTGLMKVVTSLTGLVADTPMMDAAMALIPGLLGQSRVGNNQDVTRLRTVARSCQPDYFAICSNFEPESPGWRFWKYFTNPAVHGLDAVGDQIFQEDNDLVVDTRSMHDLSDGLQIPANKCFTFPTTDEVHHLNYFEKTQTIDKLTKWLKLGQPP